MIRTVVAELETQGFCDVHDLTGAVQDCVIESGIKEGVVTVFVPGATAGITTVEYEEGLRQDLNKFFEEIVPRDGHYEHNVRWGDGNGFSHVRASLLGPSLQVPVVDGRPTLGTWQQVVLVDFDNRPRERRVILQAMGE